MAVVLVGFTIIQDLLAQVDSFGSRLIKRDIKSKNDFKAFFQRNKSAIIKVTTIALAITGISYLSIYPFLSKQDELSDLIINLINQNEKLDSNLVDKISKIKDLLGYSPKLNNKLSDLIINLINQNEKLDSNLIDMILKIKGLLRYTFTIKNKLADLINNLIDQSEKFDSNLIDKILKIKGLLGYSSKIEDKLEDLILNLINQNEKLDSNLIDMILKIKDLIEDPSKLNNKLSNLIFYLTNQYEELDAYLIDRISKLIHILEYMSNSNKSRSSNENQCRRIKPKLLSKNIEERAIDPKLKANCLDHQVQLINPEYDLKSTSTKEFKQECKKHRFKWHPDKNSNPKKAQTVSSRINPACEEVLEAKKRQST